MKQSIRSNPRRRFFIHPTIVAAAMVIAGSPSLHAADVLFQENFEAPDVPSYSQGITADIWVRAALGYGSGDHGMTDKSGGNFSAPAGNDQAYAFRYTNSGITTKEKALGSPLAMGGGYEVSFDVVKDNSNSGTGYNVTLIAFGTGAVRNDCRSTPTGSTVLATKTGNASNTGSITTVSFTFIPNATTHAAEFGKDLGIRVIGSLGSAIIDNIRFRAIPGTGAGLSLVTTSPLDNSVNNLATKSVKAIFSKNIAAGSGNVTLRNLTDVVDTVIPVGDARLTLSGTCLDILPGPHLEWNKNYAVLVDSGAILETPGGTPFTGISNDTTWNFITAGGDPLLFSISQLKSHINGTITLSAGEIDTIKRNLDSEVTRFAEGSGSITALLDLVTTYDTATDAARKGPLWVVRTLPRRDVVTNDLHWTMFNVMQNIMDRIYTGQTLASHEALLTGFKFGSSSNFPGPCAAPAPNTHTATLSASYLKTYGPPTIQDGPGTYARKPTGTYLAPGTIATVTVPPSMVGTGYKIRVGCHSWDFGAKPDIKRLDRVTRVYDVTALQTKIASPLGGGIYIEVPWLANAGVVTVDITGAVRSPYFSAKSFHTTTSAQWTTERAHPAPWADFQTDKFMMQVPKSWISSMTGAQAIQLMADWDASMDAVNALMGYPLIRGKESMYPQVDLLLKNSVYAPGYPSVNTTYSPTGSYGGYATSHLVRGPQNAPDYEFHELGHGYLFPKFAGETESAVNLLHVPVMNRKFGKSMDDAFRGSRGYTRTYMTLDTTAMAWMCVFNFSPREVPMADGEKAYQLKGHAKFVDIANLYGWGVLGDFWKSMVDLDETNTAYATDNDAMMLRLCKAVGKDIRPLLHFWGIHPQNPATLAANIAAANLPPDVAIKNRLLYYKTLVPANNAAFRTFATGWWGKQPSITGNWEEREHSRQWDTAALYGVGDQQRSEATNPGEIYNENSANDIRNRVDELVNLYFPDSLLPNPMSFAVAPTGAANGAIGMVAATATTSTGSVEYWFENSTNGNNSGWIASTTWINTGLTNGASYNFRVKARDTIGNETGWSALSPANAEPDSTAPLPNPMTFASAPTATGPTAITMTASTASDVNGVEYFFDCTTVGGPDSGWQVSPAFNATGLSPGTQYTYVVRARDSVGNTTANSASGSATTASPNIIPPIANPNFDPPAEVTSDNPSPGYGLISSWIRSGTTSGVNPSSLPFLSPQSAHSGTYVAFIQGSGNISQSLTGFDPSKLYTVTYFVSERGYSTTPVTSTSVSLNGGTTSSTQTDNIRKTDKFRRIVSGPLAVSGDVSTLRITATGVSGDNTLLIDTVSLSRAVPRVPDGGFENPVQPGTAASGFEQGNGSGSGTLTGSLWNFGATVNGIARNASSYTSTAADYAPEGSQAAMLLGVGEFSTTVNGFEPWVTYTLSFSAKGRGSSLGPNTVRIQLGGQTLGFSSASSVTPGTSAWATYTTDSFTTAGGNLPLQIIGLTAGDKTTFIDDLRFNFFAEAVAADPGFDDYISNPAFGIALAQRGFNDDPDGDGLANGLEAWFGTHPGQFNSGLTNIARTGNTITFTHPQNETLPADVTGYYQWSPNLVDWYAGNGVAGPGGGLTATITADTTEATTTVTATLSGSPARIFLRAGANQVP